jgi:hypothetical protein
MSGTATRSGGFAVLFGMIGLLCALIGAVTGGRAVSRTSVTSQTLSTGLLAQGRVLDTFVVPGDQGRAGVRHAVVGFHTPDGHEYRIEEQAGRRRIVGDRVPVRYLQESPQQAVLDDTRRSEVDLAMLMLCLTVFVPACLYVSVLGFVGLLR